MDELVAADPAITVRVKIGDLSQEPFGAPSRKARKIVEGQEAVSIAVKLWPSGNLEIAVFDDRNDAVAIPVDPVKIGQDLLDRIRRLRQRRTGSKRNGGDQQDCAEHFSFTQSKM